MPLTTKGRKIMANMVKEYGSGKAKKVFYSSRNAGRITGVDPESSGHKKRKRNSASHGRRKGHI